MLQVPLEKTERLTPAEQRGQEGRYQPTDFRAIDLTKPRWQPRHCFRRLIPRRSEFPCADPPGKPRLAQSLPGTVQSPAESDSYDQKPDWEGSFRRSSRTTLPVIARHKDRSESSTSPAHEIRPVFAPVLRA